MSDAAVTIIVALIGSGLISGVVSIITKLIDRKWSKDDKDTDIENKLSELEENTNENKKDITRVQMLLLMSDYPDDKAEILKIAELYFKDMGGNFYMDSLFSKWLKKQGMDKPSWFKGDAK